MIGLDKVNLDKIQILSDFNSVFNDTAIYRTWQKNIVTKFGDNCMRIVELDSGQRQFRQIYLIKGP